MEFILQFIESLLYINEEIFWLKECLIAFKSLLIFLFFRWIISWNSRQVVLLCLSTVIGVACIFLGDIGYFSDNDVLKLIAPISFFLLVCVPNPAKPLSIFFHQPDSKPNSQWLLWISCCPI
mgnify:CR=1 FL=1